MEELKNLIIIGRISSGEKIIWNRRGKRILHEAVINENGTITTSDGNIHRTPSGAAKYLNDGKPVDGWLVWHLKSTNLPLSSYRL